MLPDMQNTSGAKKVLALFVEQINCGIAENGIHILDGDKLSQIWNHDDSQPDNEKRLQVENFARANGFTVLLGSSLRIAIFQKPN